MTTHLDDYVAFLAASPTSYHAVAEIVARLRAAGYTEQIADAPWEVTAGGRFLVRDGAVVAWRVPDDWSDEAGVRIVGSHTDSPALKLKPNPAIWSAGWAQLGVEVYGGPLLGTWLDRELGLAGRLVTPDGDVVLTRTGPLLRVPHLAPHLDRELGNGVILDRQANLQPIFGVGSAPDVFDLLAAAAGLDGAGAIAGFDVFCYPTEKPGIFGSQGEFIAAGRMDNLSSVHASLTALLHDDSAGPDIAIIGCFDHEEVGSATRSGAAGPLLEEVLRRTAGAVGLDEDGYHRLLSRTVCVSADAGHAVHPNYPNHHDPVNRPVLNAGPLLKVNASQRYASDAVGSARWARACAEAGVPTQHFVSNNAVPCGSTIGPITATRLGIVTVDVGVPLLSMHSARELAGVLDPGYLSLALVSFLAGA